MSTEEGNVKNIHKFLHIYFSEEKGKAWGKEEDTNITYKI